MAVIDDDSVQRMEGTAPTVDQLIVDIVGPTSTQQGLHPIQTQWPPAYLGMVPDAHKEPFDREDAPSLENVRKLKRPGRNPLLAIWSASSQRIGSYDYLVLPPAAPGEPNDNWIESHHPGYPSNRIMIRKSYEKAFSMFLLENARLYRQGSHLALGGTSGLGKTFCYRYIIWRLFHPDGVEVLTIPDTIFLWTNPKDAKGYLYHKGSFYSMTSIGEFLSTALAQNIFDNQDAWMICDGAPPTTYMECPIVVSSSPANFQSNDITDAKKFFKTSNLQVYLPPWTADEIWEAAHNVYGLAAADEEKLLERFRMFGGIARSIFLNFTDGKTPKLKDLFVLTDVTTAINEVGSTDLNHQKVSGMILHVIPDNTLTNITYQWGSTAIMETAFEKMFHVSKNKIQTFLHAGIGLHLGTFYGLLFEPYFHARVTQQGYSGRIRRLTPSQNDGTMVPRASTKRTWYRANKLVAEVDDHEIPPQKLHHFHTHSQIEPDCYNVPDRKNFAAVDAVAPALGEMYQVTSSESHTVKGIHLRPLRRCFENYLATGQRVKLIFVVPPNRFETYKEQNYIFPARKTDKKAKGKEKDDEESKKKEADEYDLATWDEDEAEDDGKDEATSKANLLQEVNSWVEQWVMEVNVDPLLKTLDKRVQSEVKRSFLREWTRPFTSKKGEKKEEKNTE